ncbi:DUF5403 family protein [Amycolatopsis cihanbeyliensis]|uniref:Uncharacterized protein n=1 Tax=Amycolatopsis cihanbeyliensis TaxID=1128664 RepID=A0A542DNK8_AMYCI|nr:DUF5403 family protein [Amycolatopsis cihanbeyliensis]TQJ04692.1 hypothetical protein FB471_4499 [Amycolatopsis cihanbeyliensis]
MARVYQRRARVETAHLDGVVAAVREQAQKVGRNAEIRLTAHRDEGHAEITVTYGQVDSFVNLDDLAALSIEFGHVHNVTGRYVAGLYIITGAANLI